MAYTRQCKNHLHVSSKAYACTHVQTYIDYMCADETIKYTLTHTDLCCVVITAQHIQL